MVVVREATDGDSEAVIALIATIFEEYPGCVLDVDREEPELRAPATSFDRFWVLLDDGGRVAGTVAAGARDDHVELKKLYLARALRGRGYGRELAGLVEDYARDRAVARIELWSDTRFELAHRLYERLGYRATGRTRDLEDLSGTTEFHYVKDLG